MKRPRGFRTITVGAQVLFWQFRTTEPSELVVVAGGSRLVVRLTDWRDPWLTISEVHVSDGVMTFGSAPNEPEIVGPGFVRRAVDFALANGWHPVERGPDVKVVFSADSFEMRR